VFRSLRIRLERDVVASMRFVFARKGKGSIYATWGTALLSLLRRPFRIPMKTHVASSALVTMLLSLLAANMAAGQLASTCVENSPERRGDPIE